jgi:hypothetical protein
VLAHRDQSALATLGDLVGDVVERRIVTEIVFDDATKLRLGGSEPGLDFGPGRPLETLKTATCSFGVGPAPSELPPIMIEKR